MNQTTLEWIDKAEGDWNSALLLFRARKHPNYNNACFLAQQCAEKYLKARLQEAGIPFAKTHDLLELHKQILPIEPSWDALYPDLKALNDYAVDYRYPGMDADKVEAKTALAHCRTVRKAARQSFGLPV